MSTLITNIGELVTNAPGPTAPAAGPGPFAAIDRRGAGHRGRPGGVDRAGRGRRPPPTRWSTAAAGRSCRASSTRTPTWCSRASAAPSSPRGWRAPPYQAGGIRSTVAATRAASDEQLRANLAPARAEMLAPGHDHAGMQVRVRAHGGRRARAASRSPPRSRRRSPSSARTWCRRVRGRPRRLPGPGLRARCWPRARRRPGGSTCSASGGAFGADEARAVLAAGEAARPDAADARQPARPGAGRPARGGGRAPPRPTTART